MVINEINNIRRQIQLHEHILDCLQVKLFYLNNKMFESDFAENENKLDVIKTRHRVEIEKSRLRDLHTDFKLKLELAKVQ